MIPTEIEDGCAGLIQAAGFDGEFTLQPIADGGNNRVFRVVIEGETLLLKSYFRHPDDPRDRLGTEYAFCDFAWRHGVRAVPRPFAADPALGLGLYEFVEGVRLGPTDLGGEAVGQALDFFRALNRHKHKSDASQLPDGSEACFSIDEHLHCVEARLQRLGTLDPQSDTDRAVLDLLRGGLEPAWEAVAGEVRRRAGEDARLGPEGRCLSPSDFGFHNALREPGGRIRFLDFEYAGWDDPAKLVCDFFCQPAVPVPMAHFDAFASGAVEGLPEPEWHLHRIRLLLPVYRIKWCCILLNDFLPVGRARRRFALSAADFDARKADQLRKARIALEHLELPSHP